MKKIHRLIWILQPLIWIPMPSYSQWPAEVDGAVIISDLIITENKDSLLLGFEIGVFDRAVSNRQCWHLVPELKNPDYTSIFLPSVLINGKQRQRHFERKEHYGNVWQNLHYPDQQVYIERKDKYPEKNIKSITYYLELPYEDWMDNAVLILHQYLGSPKNIRQLFSMPAGGVELQERVPYQVHPKVNYIVPEREDKSRSAKYSAFLDFPTGVSAIRTDYRDNPAELTRMSENIARIYLSDYFTVERIFLEGYASPEGSYTLNERLSKERAEAVKQYLVSTYGIPADLVHTSSVSEDWAGLSALVAASGLSGKEKLIEIIDGMEHPDVRESKLRAHPQWHTLLTEYFPQLRRTEYSIDFSVKDFLLSQSRQFVESDSGLLSHLEIYEIAMSYGDPRERIELLEMAFHQYPEDIIAINNYVAALLDNGEFATANRYLERAGEQEKLCNNLGVALLFSDDLQSAEKEFEKAIFLGIDEAGHNLAETRRKIENNQKLERSGKRSQKDPNWL